MKPSLRQEGLSPIVGAVLVIGIFTGLAVTVYSSYSRAASRNEEGETLSSLLRSFLQVKEGMVGLENGETFSVQFKLNVGGRAGGTLWAKSNWGGSGGVGFTSRGMETGDVTLLLEEGCLIRLSREGADMLSPPAMLKISGVRVENMVRWLRVDVHHLVVENCWLQLASTSPLNLRFVCTSDNYRVAPENGRPNREKVVLNLENLVSSETRRAWREYLQYAASLYPPHYGISLSPETLTLTVEGFENTPGINDLLYYERWTGVRVEVA